MAEYECPNCNGGFPETPDQECPWCGQAIDGNYETGIRTVPTNDTTGTKNIVKHEIEGGPQQFENEGLLGGMGGVLR